MDVGSPFFSLDQIEELFQFSSIPSCGQEQSSVEAKDPLLPLKSSNDAVSVKPDNRKHTSLSVTCGDTGDGDLKKKKTIHRDVERQRRQEMAVLYKSLRSQLPNEYLKGKRSISDHMHEAVKYIKQLQNKIEGLNERREEVKRSLEKGSVGIGKNDHLRQTVTVETTRSGVEVVVSSISKGGVPVSRVLHLLIQEGLNVVSCISRNTNGRLHHCIQCEVLVEVVLLRCCDNEELSCFILGGSSPASQHSIWGRLSLQEQSGVLATPGDSAVLLSCIRLI